MKNALPPEFSREAIAAASEDAEMPYRDFVDSREPYRSLYKANPWMRAPRTGDELIWGEGKYYDTTIARKHSYWKDISLPVPTKDISRLRRDLHEWGYCLIEDALSSDQNERVYRRVVEQAGAPVVTDRAVRSSGCPTRRASRRRERVCRASPPPQREAALL